MKITDVETFTVTLPVSDEERRLHKVYSEGVVRVSTDEDITFRPSSTGRRTSRLSRTPPTFTST